MTRNEATGMAWGAFRLGKAGLTHDEFAAVLRIAKLNRRAVSAWERENDGGRDNERRQADGLRNARAHAEAVTLARAHGWTLERSGGLWWHLYRCEADRDGGHDDMLAGML